MDTWTRLLERAFGGEDVAAAPGDASGDFWPLSPPPANADLVVDGLINAATSGSVEAPKVWVILVGSAGNGKSVLAKRVAQALGVTRSGFYCWRSKTDVERGIPR